MAITGYVNVSFELLPIEQFESMLFFNVLNISP